MSKDRTKCTIIYQGQEADIDDEAAVHNLLTPMFQGIIKGAQPMRNRYLFPEFESTAIELAILVGRLEQVKDEKKEANADFKEQIDLLEVQIKRAAKIINEGVAGKVNVQVKSGVPGYVPEHEGEAAH